MRLFPEPLRTLILERAGGNPLYLEEVVRALIAAGVLVRDGDGWRSAPEAATAQVPSTLQGLLLARLDRLDAAERRVLQEAAVIGPRFDAALLRAVSGEPAQVDAALAALVRAELVAPGPDHRFRHGLLQETVYQNILVAGRTELHTRVGTALESQGAVGPESLERLEALGHHWALGTDKARGARYLMAAGDWARGMYANADAIRHYRRALVALEHCDAVEAEQLVARERMADLLGPIGRRAAALGEYEIVEAGYRAAGDAPAQARILRKMGGLHWDAGARARALQCFEAGLGLLAEDREHIEQAHLYQEMGRLAFRSGDSQRAVEWAEEARRHAERLAADPGLGADGRAEAAAAAAQSHNTLGVASARLGRMEEAVGHIERSVTLAREAGLLQAACRGLANLSVLYSTLDPARAIETCAAGLEMAKKIGDLGFQSRLYANLAVAYCALTNRCDEQGIGAAHAAIDLDRRLGQLDHLAVPLIVLGQIYQCHGDPTRAIAHYGKRSRSPRKRTSRNVVPPAMMVSPPSTWTWATMAGRKNSCRRPRRCASEPDLSPTHSWCCRSWIDSNTGEFAHEVHSAAPRRPGPSLRDARGESRGPGHARRLSRAQSGPARPVPRPALTLLPAPARAAGHHAGQAQGSGRGDSGDGQHAARSRAALLQVPSRARAARGGPGGGDAPGVRRASGRDRRGRVGRFVAAASHGRPAAGGGDQSQG